MASDVITDPYWWDAAPPRRLDPAPVGDACDAVVVGAGYTGLSAALTLARAGRTVQVFDRQRPGEGASSRNGGMASGNIRSSFGALAKAYGLERAKAIYGEGARARVWLTEFIAAEGIDCDLVPVGRVTGGIHPEDYDGFCREADLLNQHLDLGAQVLDRNGVRDEIGNELYYSGMLRPDIGGLHPAKYVSGLLDSVLAAGVPVHGETAVLGLRRDGDAFEVKTARGTVRARDVVMATNGYTDGVDPWLRRRLVPAKSRIVATAPLSPNLVKKLIPNGRMLGETRKLYHYFRPSPDGTRILMGGREAGANATPAQATDMLRRDLAMIFPELADVEITHSWNGNVAFNMDFLPRLFVKDGVHYAVGYCGSGVVWASWLGRKAALRLLGDPEGDSAFACDRPTAVPVPLYDGNPWFLPLAFTWFSLQDRFKFLRNL
ncbi:MAG: FAD-binding oxidoreductase [Hyphomicrobiales bacterium]|nr:FAD-binding oxidoreductase [Hyphomicrobiales bacterium]